MAGSLMVFVHTSKAVLLHNSLIWVGNLTKGSFPEILCSGFAQTAAVVTADLGLGWHKVQRLTNVILVSCSNQNKDFGSK